jgi:hypothetical protein
MYIYIWHTLSHSWKINQLISQLISIVEIINSIFVFSRVFLIWALLHTTGYQERKEKNPLKDEQHGLHQKPGVNSFYIAISLKQQSVDKHVALLRRIILVRIQAVFLLTPYYFVFSEEAANTNCIAHRYVEINKNGEHLYLLYRLHRWHNG